MNHRVFFSGAISAMMVGVPAFADDLTISTGTATAVTTATAANGTPGNITIGSSGSVTIAAAGAAVTLNSNNVVVNNGTISNTVDTSAVGVQINPGNTGSFTNNGAIKIPGNGTPPTSTGQFGILLNGTGVFTGDIVTTSGSTITISGLSANAIAIQSELSGKFTQGGTITSSGSLSNGVITSALIDGAFTNTGTITTDRGTGNTGTVNPGSPVAIGGSIAGGFLNAGPVSSTDTTAPAVISAVGAPPALIIAPSTGLDVSDVTLGVYSDSNTPGYGFLNRGKITATGDLPGVSATTIQIGDTSDNTSGKITLISGGIFNSGTISATATSDAPNTVSSAANATTIVVGNATTIPLLTNDARGTITAATGGTVGGNAIALLIETGGSLPTLNNAGIISASANVTNTATTSLSAHAIQDMTGTLTSITNSGTISATATALDAGGQKTIAADLSLATAPITFTNTGTVTGDILFGKANASQLTIEGSHALVAGSIQAIGGTVNVAVSGGGTGGTLQTSHAAGLGTLNVGPQGTLNLGVGANTPVVSATGAISFDAQSHLVLTPVSLLPTTSSIQLIHSDTSLSFGNYAATTAGIQIPFLFTGGLSSDSKNLVLTLQRKTVSQLGLTGNAAEIFEPALNAALLDNSIGAALGTLTTSAEVQSSVEQLLPITSGASLSAIELLTDSNTNAVGDRQRMLLLDPSPMGGFSVWGQGLYGMFHGSGDDGYTGHGAGGVIGFDFSQANRGHFGLALTIYDSKFHEKSPLIADTDVKSYLISPYLGFRSQSFFFNAQLNAGEARLDTVRTVNVGSVTRVANGQSDEMVASGGLTGGYIWDLGLIRLMPQISINGVAVFAPSYTESGGGQGVDLTVNSHHQTAVRSFVGVSADGNYEALGARLMPQFLAGWSQELVSASQTVNAAFAAVPDSTFQVTGPQAASSRLIAGAGLNYVTGDWSIGLNYNATISSSALSQGAGLTMSARF